VSWALKRLYDALWHCYTRYLFHKNSKHDDINDIVNGPYEVTGLTLQEACIKVEAACAWHEKCIAAKLANLRCAKRFHSPYKTDRRELIHRFGSPDRGPFPSPKTRREHHGELLIHTFPEWPSWPDVTFHKDRFMLADPPDQPDYVDEWPEGWPFNYEPEEDEPPPLSLHHFRPSDEDSSSSSEDESEDESDDETVTPPEIDEADFTEIARHHKVEMFNLSKCYIGQSIPVFERPPIDASHESRFMFAQANVHPLFTTGVVMNQSSAPSPDLKLGWLLDNQSTDYIACNHNLVVLGPIVKADHKMRIHTNAVILVVTQKCRVAGYP
jgi:hypothetical protein